MTRTETVAASVGTSRLRRVAHCVFRPIDAAWLAAFRVLFGSVLCVSMLRFLIYGWVERFFVEPSFFFKYWGFEWVQPLPGWAMHALFVLLALLALTMALGLAFRISAIGLAIGLSYFQLIDVSTYLNHYYLAALLAWLLAFSPAGTVDSLDAWLARRQLRPVASAHGAPERASVSAAWLYLFRVQVGVVYCFAGLAKAQSDWLLHAQPLRIWLGASTELPVIGPLFTLDGVPELMSWFGFLFDATIVLWLSLRRTRPFAFVLVIVFHVLTRILFPIGMFPAFMIVSALAFFEPDWPRRLMGAARRLAKRISPRLSTPNELESASVGAVHVRLPTPRDGLASDTLAHRARLPSRWARVGWTVAGAYALLQVLMPLRFIAYGGNVLWHEQGMRFSWRVMVRAKGGSTEFVVSNPATGAVWHVDPGAYLTPLQESEMASQPDLILQMAHHIERDFESGGLGPVEVRAESRVALNGRRSVALVDPSVDLSTVRDGLGRVSFVLPAPSEPPARTRPVP